MEAEKEESAVFHKQVDLEGKKKKKRLRFLDGRLEKWSYQRPKTGKLGEVKAKEIAVVEF